VPNLLRKKLSWKINFNSSYLGIVVVLCVVGAVGQLAAVVHVISDVGDVMQTCP